MVIKSLFSLSDDSIKGGYMKKQLIIMDFTGVYNYEFFIHQLL